MKGILKTSMKAAVKHCVLQVGRMRQISPFTMLTCNVLFNIDENVIEKNEDYEEKYLSNLTSCMNFCDVLVPVQQNAPEREEIEGIYFWLTLIFRQK